MNSYSYYHNYHWDDAYISKHLYHKANDHFSYQNVVECNHAIMLHGNYYYLDISLGLHIAAKNDTYIAIKMSGSESRGQEV